MMSKSLKTIIASLIVPVIFCLVSCDNYFKNDYDDNSPTSGKLKIYYDEGLELHVKNQAVTFESQYANARLYLVQASETDAVQALYTDSCESIVLSRSLTDKEQKVFESKNYFPKYSVVAKSGVALITNNSTNIKKLSYNQVIALLTKPFEIKDSVGNNIVIKVIFDKNNSSVVHYLKDSVLKGNNFSANCNILNSTIESINFVAENKNTIAFIDYAWLSDGDDSLFKANQNKIRFISVACAGNDSIFEYPSQSSFKLNTYPFTRKVYVYRKVGDFTLAKGFESFVAGPKGQLTFLKQGLLPGRQSERQININTKPITVQ